ncbi:recombinase family protein [Paracoccus solventivorans]
MKRQEGFPLRRIAGRGRVPVLPEVPMPAAAFYARHSSDLQDPRSIDNQLNLCREYAARQGWTIVSCYHNEAVSGAHAVRSLVRWEPSTVLQKLCVNAVGGTLSAFQDGGFPFYHLHALEWLFVALYRVAIDAPERIAEAFHFLHVWTATTANAKIRGLAARIALSLHRSGVAISCCRAMRGTTSSSRISSRRGSRNSGSPRFARGWLPFGTSISLKRAVSPELERQVYRRRPHTARVSCCFI